MATRFYFKDDNPISKITIDDVESSEIKSVSAGIKLDSVESNITKYISVNKNISTSYSSKSKIKIQYEKSQNVDFSYYSCSDFSTNLTQANTSQYIRYTKNWIGDKNLELEAYQILSGYANKNYLDVSSEVSTYSITNNLVNVYSDNSNPKFLEAGKSFTLTYHANANCKIDTCTTNYSTSITYNQEKTQVIIVGTASSDLVVNITASDTRKKVFIIGTLIKCTCNYKDSDYIESNKNILLTADEGYYFPVGNYYCLRGDNSVKMTRNAGGVSLEVSPTLSTYNYTLNGTYKAISKYPTIDITGSLVNATCNFNSGDIIHTGDTIKIKATDGYTFKNEFYRLYTYDKNGVRTMQTFIKNDLSTELSYTISSISSISKVELDDTYRATKAVSAITDFNKIYFPTIGEINSLSKERIVTVDTHQYFDYGQYITGLYMLPFSIENDYKGDKDNIMLGNTSTETQATSALTWLYTKELGELDITKKYNNCFDFINTNIKILLPFYGIYEPDIYYIIGQKIRIDFELNLYNGKAKYYLYSSLTGELFDTLIFNIGNSIPIVYNNNFNINSNYTDNNKYNSNKIIILIERNTPYNNQENVYFGKEIYNYTQLKNMHSYTKVKDVKLEVKCTSDEEEKIKNLLEKGVII